LVYSYVCAGFIIGPGLVILHVSKFNSFGFCVCPGTNHFSHFFFNFNNYSFSHAVTLYDLFELEVFSMCINLWVVTLRIVSEIGLVCWAITLVIDN